MSASAMEIVILGPVLNVSRLSFQVGFHVMPVHLQWDQLPPINLWVPFNRIWVGVPQVITVTVTGKISMKTTIQSSTTKFTSEFLCPVPPGAVRMPEARPPPSFPAPIQLNRQNRVLLLPDLPQAVPVVAAPAARRRHLAGRVLGWLIGILIAGGLIYIGVQFAPNLKAFSGN